MAEPIVVLDGYTLNPGDLDWAPLRRFGELTVYDRTPADLVADRAAGAPYVLTNKTMLSAEHFEVLTELKYVGVLATGYNVVDLEAARQHQVAVTNVPAYGTTSVAQHTFALLLQLGSRVAEHDAAVRDGRWIESDDFCFTVTSIVEWAGKTLGIVGLGAIGQRVAQVAGALGLSVIAAESPSGRRPTVPGVEVGWRPLDDVFREADVISLHCPLTPQTERLVDERRLGLMKRTAYLLNTARGALVDEQALVEALEGQRIAGAGLDVLGSEPPDPSNPLLTAPRCVITPHIAWASREARQRLMKMAADNLEAFMHGRPTNVVN
jgi:glycerate dehydrogenase